MDIVWRNRTLSNNQDKKDIFILLGPTGIGKTKLSLALAKQMTNIEIISADSMQIYKYMDIGTDKPDKAILNTLKHHMIDIIKPDEHFDVSKYCQMASQVILDILKREKIPLMVGGTGLYFSSMISPLFSGPGKDLKFRRILSKLEKNRGINHLYEKLSTIDPDSAKKIHHNDLQRIIRALEVYEITGKTMTLLRKESKEKNRQFNFRIFGFLKNREDIYKQINARVDRMIEKGLIDEVKLLRDMGYREHLNAMQGLGYKQINKYLNHEYDKDIAVERIKIDTRHYAKRQMTWFKNKINGIDWFDLDQLKENEIISKIKKKISEVY